MDVREKIDAFSKFEFEAQFQVISSGGAISYVEVPNMQNNLPALEEVVKYIYEHIQYAEFNTKSDYCHVCGYDGEIIINDNLEWECPNCGNKDHDKMNVTRRPVGIWVRISGMWAKPRRLMPAYSICKEEMKENELRRY